MAETKWETVISRDFSDYGINVTDRLEVPGGWLYRCTLRTQKAESEGQVVMTMCFVRNPDTPGHAE